MFARHLRVPRTSEDERSLVLVGAVDGGHAVEVALLNDGEGVLGQKAVLLTDGGRLDHRVQAVESVPSHAPLVLLQQTCAPQRACETLVLGAIRRMSTGHHWADSFLR